MTTTPVDPSPLFDLDVPPVSLADKFGMPPMSVLDRRSGAWRARRRAWDAIGIRSDEGRDAGALSDMAKRDDFMARVARGEAGTNGPLLAGGISLFDPVLCELAYRWLSIPGDRVLDPFAGGAVRGIVASTLARWYVGIDVREEQVDANRRQAHLGSSIAPEWITGDATRLPDALADDTAGFDLLFTCPPYGDLEVYSDHPRDISSWSWPDFIAGQEDAVRHAASALRPDRFAAWVTSDIRDPSGQYRGLVHETVRHFRSAGLTLQSDAVILDSVGMAALRAERSFRATRRLTRVHQHLLIFVKGSAQRAAARLEVAA
jgi:hypothetical protein